jgi:hypothetical protein
MDICPRFEIRADQVGEMYSSKLGASVNDHDINVQDMSA